MTEESPKRSKSGVTPNDELRELIDEWRNPPEWMYESASEEKAVEMCADELEQVIDDE